MTISFLESNTSSDTTIVLESVPLLVVIFGGQVGRFLLLGTLQVPYPSARPNASDDDPKGQRDIQKHAPYVNSIADGLEGETEKFDGLGHGSVRIHVHHSQEAPPQNT